MKKLIKMLCVSAMMLASLCVSAGNWAMYLDTNDGWTTEDGTVTVTYTLDKNPYTYGANLNINCCAPNIIAKIKNNSDDFIYVDLSKTYILRNGEAELYQNILSMSTSKEAGDDDEKKTVSQKVMPIPPHATKTFTFPLFACTKQQLTAKNVKVTTGYEPFLEVSIYNNLIFHYDANQAEGTSKTYNSDNSPLIAMISFAYSTTEDTGKPTRISKEFWVNKAVRLKNSKNKELEKASINLDENVFIEKAESI